MKKKFRRLLSVITALAVAATMTGSIMSLSYADETEPQADVTTTLGMFTPQNSSVTVNDNATATVEFTIPLKGSTVKCYDKIALVEQTESDEVKDAAAVEATVNEDGSSTFKFDVNVDKLGKQIPFSTHRVYTDETKAAEWNAWSAQHYITFDSPSVVDQMIGKIYVQSRNEYTDDMCAAAKACWDGLSAEQQALVEEYDYYGADTGDASKDDPLNKDGIGEKELLVVSFGTSFNDNRAATIGAIEKALADAYPGYSVRRAFTAQIIINHIQSRDGYRIDNVEQAMEIVIKTSKAKFDETIELHTRLGVDGRHADQQVRGAIVLPHGIGKTKRVLVFAKGPKATEAEEAGADFVGAEEMAQKIQSENWFDFDVVIATPDMMGVVGRLGKILGPKGLMPNPKSGTVTMDVAKAIEEVKAGKVEYRLDKSNIIHTPIGKASFGPQKLAENFETLIGAIIKAKPAAAKGQYLRSVTVASTMGPGVKINPMKLG